MTRKQFSGAPKGWKILSQDMNWEDHGGRWARRDRHYSNGKRAFNVCRFENMRSHGIHDMAQYECAIGWIDLDSCGEDLIKSALDSCGYVLESDGVQIVQPFDGAIIASDEITRDLVILDAIVGHGGIDWDFSYAEKGARKLRGRCVRGL